MTLSAIDLGEGPAVMLLHGQPGSGGDWEPVTRRLCERLRVIAPDRPGYGRTGGRAVGFRENADAAIELLDDLGVDSVVLVGHSWGSGVALAAAAGFPRRVRALVLAAPVYPGLPQGPIDRALAHPRLGPLAARLGFGIAGLGLTLPPVRRLARRAVPSLPARQIATTAAEWRGSRVSQSFFAEQRALVLELPSLAPALGSIEAPATVLTGTRDGVSPPKHARTLALSLRHAELVTAPGAGHMLPQQRPELLAEAISRVASHSV